MILEEVSLHKVLAILLCRLTGTRKRTSELTMGQDEAKTIRKKPNTQTEATQLVCMLNRDCLSRKTMLLHHIGILKLATQTRQQERSGDRLQVDRKEEQLQNPYNPLSLILPHQDLSVKETQ